MVRSRKSNSRSSKRKPRRSSNKRSRKSSVNSSKNITLADLLSTTPMALRTARDPFSLPNKHVTTYENIPYQSSVSLTSWQSPQSINTLNGNNPFKDYFGKPASAHAVLSHGPMRPTSSHSTVASASTSSTASAASFRTASSSMSTALSPEVQPMARITRLRPTANPTLQPIRPTANPTTTDLSDDDLKAQLLADVKKNSDVAAALLRANNTNANANDSSQNGGNNNSLLDKMFQIAGSLWN